MSDHVVAIIQARISSSRFPRKCFADIGGKPMIQHVVDRARAIPGIQTVLVAVPIGEGAEFQRVLGFSAFEGPGDDVLKRYAFAAQFLGADIIVRLTADCPLFDPTIAGMQVERAIKDPSTFYQSSITADGSLDGLDVETFRRWLLDAADREATDTADREHVTPWMRRNCIRQRTVGPSFAFKLSVDTADDLLRVRSVVEQLAPGQFTSTATLIACARAGVWEAVGA